MRVDLHRKTKTTAGREINLERNRKREREKVRESAGEGMKEEGL